MVVVGAWRCGWSVGVRLFPLGLSDWAGQHEQQMRTRLAHAAANADAVVLFGASFAVRGHRPRAGRAPGFGGLVGAGAGGRLAWRQAADAHKTGPVAHLVEPGRHRPDPVADLKRGTPERRILSDGAPVSGPATAPQPCFETRTEPDGVLVGQGPSCPSRGARKSSHRR